MTRRVQMNQSGSGEALRAGATLLLGLIGAGLWATAVAGVLSPHPWVFMALGLGGMGFELGAIAMAGRAFSQGKRSRATTGWLIVIAALPPLLVLVLALVNQP